MRLYMDSQALNKVTIKNKHSIPLIVELFDQLGKARYFSKLDLQSGYWQIQIAEGDEAKTTCITRYGAFKFLVMSFGLTNASATFCLLVNQLFHDYLNKFVVIFLDDTVVYSQTLEEHVEHPRRVGSGLIVWMRRKFVVQEWRALTKVTELRSFLGYLSTITGDSLLPTSLQQNRHLATI